MIRAQMIPYDAENRLVNYGGTATYGFDGHGLRVTRTYSSTTTVYIFNGAQVIAEYALNAAPTAPTREYIYAGQLLAKVETSGTTYYYPDHLSARMTKAGSDPVQEQGHYPFGESWYGGTDKWRFTTYERDTESGNDYAINRSFVNRYGRFLTPDPSGATAVDPTNPQTWNRYAYVGNDPLGFIDPLGLCPAPGVYDDHPHNGCLFVMNYAVAISQVGWAPPIAQGLGGGGSEGPLWSMSRFEVEWYLCAYFGICGGDEPNESDPGKPESKAANNGQQPKCISRSSLPWSVRAELKVLSWMAQRSGGVRGIGAGGAGAFSPPSLVGGGGSVQALWVADYLGQQGLYWSVSGGPTVGEKGFGAVGGFQYMTSTVNRGVIIQDVVNSSLSVGGGAGAGFGLGVDLNLQTGVFTETIGFGTGGFGGSPAGLNIASGFIPICHE